MVGGLSVRDRSRARGVIGNHPAQRRPAGGRDIGTERQTVGCRRGVELVQYDARVHLCRAGVGVDGDGAKRRAIDDETGPDRLTRQARAGAAQRPGDVMGVACRDRGLPVTRLGGSDTPIPFASALEEMLSPKPDLLPTLRKLLEY